MLEANQHELMSAIRFGDYELDPRRGVLSYQGTPLKLQPQPFRVLELLVARAPNIVTREQLSAYVWGDGVYVDIDQSLNFCIRQIRSALNDTASNPRFVDTLPKQGYRFIAPIHPEVPDLAPASLNSTSREPQQSPWNDAPRSTSAAAPAVETLSDSHTQPFGLHHSSSLISRSRIWLVALIAFAIFGIFAAARYRQNRSLAAIPKISSLAVLPLDNLSGDPTQDYLADGMTDELTTMLAKNSTLRIVSRTSAMQYKGVRRPVRQIASELGVDGILEGSIARFGDKIHMTVQLIQAPSDTHLWADSYDRDSNNVVTLPKEAAQAIAKRLNRVEEQPAPARYVNPEAHDAYLRGRYDWFQGDNEHAGKYFRKATELQPDYAPGWAGLSTYYGQGAFDDLAPRVVLPLQMEAAKKAVELDPSLPWAHLSLGASMVFSWNWMQAEQEIARAIELGPDFAEAYHFRAKMWNALGRGDEAIESEKKAMELDPFQRPFAMGLALVSARKYDAAIEDIHSRLEANPQDVSLHWMLCDAYRRKGDLKNAASEWEKSALLGGDKKEADEIRITYQKSGYAALLLRQVANFKKKSATQYVSPMEFALQYAQLGRREETLASLEDAYQQKAVYLIWVQNDPAYDFVHTDPRYQSIIKRMGLPPAY
ncbi:winged helix-turn-helix domain-containing protein [Granulicella sp. S190]|uniref:winged helix-turn-helix domain-containing tetratricopeptide repeat protein n=1 Tax=Granulicella sp. S190 TaxID=1747226 RepID=UPI00131DD480|nr:winged helix-turn-helix domain-containing protein [Granulicella sp. S190]